MHLRGERICWAQTPINSEVAKNAVFHLGVLFLEKVVDKFKFFLIIIGMTSIPTDQCAN